MSAGLPPEGFVPASYAAVVDADVRVAPDGGTYTQAEFIEFYGGTDEWDAAPQGEASNLNSSWDESYDESYDDFDATAGGMPSYPPPDVNTTPNVPSPASFGAEEKLAAQAADPEADPFIDPQACRAYAASAAAGLDKRIAEEQSVE